MLWAPTSPRCAHLPACRPRCLYCAGWRPRPDPNPRVAVLRGGDHPPIRPIRGWQLRQRGQQFVGLQKDLCAVGDVEAGPRHPHARSGKDSASSSCLGCVRISPDLPRELPAAAVCGSGAARRFAAVCSANKDAAAKITNSKARVQRHHQPTVTSPRRQHRSSPPRPARRSIRSRSIPGRGSAGRSRACRACCAPSAMIDGRKYITNPKPKNGKKKNVRESWLPPSY